MSAFLFMPHRGLLAESLRETIELNSLGGLLAHLNDGDGIPLPVMITSDNLRIEYYGVDIRIGWDQYLLSVDGYGVLGYTNGDPRDENLPPIVPDVIRG